MGILGKIFPWRRDFYALIAAHAAKTEEGVRELSEWMHSGDDSKRKVVGPLEEEADVLRRNITRELQEAFATPIDREDLFMVIHQMDEIINYANTTAVEMDILKVRPDAHMMRMSDLLLSGTQEIRMAMDKLRDCPEESLTHTSAARKVENEIEGLYRQAIRDLFEQDDIKVILKKREIYRHMSNAADRIDEVAKTLKYVIVKIM